ncbi:MAG: hypothetical protein KDF60_10930 [Calditrichaeota bacterium]|nr:hypothetical protein [Calditrichota bacterium]
MRTFFAGSLLLLLLLVCVLPGLSQERDITCFQTASPWKAELDIRSDVAIIYGVTSSFAERLASWREKGYETQMMTGSAWGSYQDYFEGRFDGKAHPDEGQVQRDGETIWHGKSVPYVVPTQGYLTYLKSLIKIAIDNGVTTIHLEEPEFWNRAGYSDGFKREWQDYYNQPWLAQHESPEATYLSNKLKHYLYVRALTELFEYAKDYGKQLGKDIRCFVPTHSLLNYSSWNIVSPEAALAHIPGLDGFIGQVWTGTAREPNYYEGVEKERTFETAFLEYGSMEAMTRPTHKQVYFLTDPIEDNPDKTWEDYKLNYEATFIAQLMYPQVNHFEVMPWPHRIFLGKYQVKDSNERLPMPEEYATQLLTLINALNNMQQNHIRFPGTKGISVLQSNTMMFQSFPEHEGYSDPQLSNFYGMALPLLKHGIPVQIVQMEHLEYPEALMDTKILIMSYANMKPLKAEYHKALADWVRKGGVLIYCGRDNDPFQNVPEWWNSGQNTFKAPAEHLFKELGVSADSDSKILNVGKGLVSVIKRNPKEFILEKGNADEFRENVRSMLDRKGWGADWQEKNVLHLERGPYEIISVLDESISNKPYKTSGIFIDLFSPDLTVNETREINPGERTLLYNMNRDTNSKPHVVASASRVSDEAANEDNFECLLRGPKNTNGVARIFTSHKPQNVTLLDSQDNLISQKYDWNELSKTICIRYDNQPEGVRVKIEL